jgi:hypothetical protein
VEWKFGGVRNNMVVDLITWENIDFQDLILESLSLIGYIFVLIMTFNAKKRNKIFAAKPFPILVIAIILGLISAFMDVLSELLWFNNVSHYNIFKSSIGFMQIASLLLFAMGILLLFRFTSFLLGDDQEK